MVAHIYCLADKFIREENADQTELLPISGKCPECKSELSWADMIKLQ